MLAMIWEFLKLNAKWLYRLVRLIVGWTSTKVDDKVLDTVDPIVPDEWKAPKEDDQPKES